MADEFELRDRQRKGIEARQMLEAVEPRLAALEEEWVDKLKRCPADAHEDRLMIQCQLNAIDGLRAEFAYEVDDGKVASEELSLLDKAKNTAVRLFGG